MTDWEAMARRQRIEIDELKETISGLRGVLRPTAEFKAEWRLTGAERRALALLALRDRVTTDQLVETVKLSPLSYGSTDSVRVVMARIRKKISVYGVEIRSLRDFGYYLPDASREIVKAALIFVPNDEKKEINRGGGLPTEGTTA